MVRENIDYVIAENASAIGKESITDLVKGTFIGTKDYFFFVPSEKTSMEVHASGNTVQDQEFFYKGMKTADYLKSQLGKADSTKQIENEILNDIAPEGEEISIVKIDETNRFKVQANFWGSGVIYNMRETRVGWKPFSLKFGKKKKEIKSFYKSHVKYVEK